MTNTQAVEKAALVELTAAIGRIEALTPEEARRARDRLLAHNREARPEDAPLTVEELAVADLDRMLCERIAAAELDTEASGKLERIRHNFARLDATPPAERSPEDKEELPY